MHLYYYILKQKESFVLDKAYEATKKLVVDYLGRILQPASIREHIRDDITKIDVTKLLVADDIDVGTQCRIHLESIADEDVQTEMQVSNELTNLCRLLLCTLGLHAT